MPASSFLSFIWLTIAAPYVCVDEFYRETNSYLFCYIQFQMKILHMGFT